MVNEPFPIACVVTFAFELTRVKLFGLTPGNADSVSVVEFPGMSATLARLELKIRFKALPDSCTVVQLVVFCTQICSVLPFGPRRLARAVPIGAVSVSSAVPFPLGIRTPFASPSMVFNMLANVPPLAVTVNGALPGSKIPI